MFALPSLRLAEGDVADLAAGHRRLGHVLCHAQRALDAAGAGTRDIAGHALHERVIKGLDDDLVGAGDAEVGVDAADVFRMDGSDGGNAGEQGEAVK